MRGIGVTRAMEPNDLEDERSRRATAHLSEDARLGALLERTFATREAQTAPPEEALARLNATLDRIAAPPRRRIEYPRMFGALALAALLLFFGSLGLSRVTIGGHNAPPSVTSPAAPLVSGDTAAVTTGRAASPIAVAAGATTNVAANAATSTTGASETPLRDLLERAGIHATSPPGGSAIERQTPLN